METGKLFSVAPTLLIANDAVALVTRFVPIKPGQGPLIQGTVLDKDGEAIEGGGEPFAILGQNINTGASGATDPVSATVYLNGCFIRQRIFLKDGKAVPPAMEAKMRPLGLTLEMAN